MKSRSVLALLALVVGLLTATAPTAGQDPHPVAQPTPTPATPPTPSPTPAPEGTKEEKEKAAGEKKWNVETPPYPMSVEAAIDTDEGTWMSLDVSPDGKEIVFDLLGDIYLIPIGGGEAKPLTSGVSWDMQPRFSPDGKRIAFTSDRSGGDNVWVMERDGSKPVQVTKETFRLPNSAVWAPDGDFLAVRKHFTGTRSLGAGEIWLYHRSGGDGLQMTKRGNEQKDLGEPAFSPDGRYLYYSQDVTPGRVFQYNKDPHGEIYAIQRLDRVTGRTERFVTGPGGAVRPTPSRDGKWLAFVRRVGPRTVLFTKDLQSGREHPVWDGLERDMQETWAIHGVYPAMAWTPDGRAIVLWSGGKIRRVDRETGGVATVPFHVKDTRKMAPAARFPVEVAPPRFPVRMLRWVQVSPSGNQVVYQALGRLWVKDLPDGAPRRLTKQTEHFELEPSYSRDGRSIVYTTWTDQKAGSVRVAPARGGEGRTITAQPGHYREPVFSPDGSRIVFRKATGGFLVTTDWSIEPGIYAVPAAGGTPRRVARDGFLPQFGSESDRVYFTKFEETEASREGREDEKRVLASVVAGRRGGARALRQRQRDGVSDLARREVAGVPRAIQRLRHALRAHRAKDRDRPQGQGPAGHARFAGRRGLSPLVRRQPHAPLGAGPGAVPPRAAGSLHVSAGRARKTARAAGAPESRSGSKPPRTFRGAALPSSGGKVVTMRGDEVFENGTVLVEGNRVTAVGPKDQVRVPAGARVIDVDRQDRPARHHRRALARRDGAGRRDPPAELGDRRGPRVRRDHGPRPVPRHRADLRRERDGAGGPRARPPDLLDRDDPLRRGGRRESRGGQPRRCARPPAAHEGRRGVQREELQPAAARSAAADPRGRERALHDGRAGRWIALPAQHDDGRGRPHRASSTPSRCRASTRTSSSSGPATAWATRPPWSSGTGVSAGRTTGTSTRRSGRTNASRASCPPSCSRPARGAGSWRAKTTSTTSTIARVAAPARRCGRPGAGRGARPAGGPRRPLGDLDARAGRHDPAPGAAQRDARRARSISAWIGISDPSSPASWRTSP